MKLMICNPRIKLLKNVLILGVLLTMFYTPQNLKAQTAAEIWIGRMWTGLVDYGVGSSVVPPTFFPNDYDIMFNRLQSAQANNGMGIKIGVPHWFNKYQTDTTRQYDTAAVYDLVGANYPPPFNTGVVDTQMTSYVRYYYTPITIDKSGQKLVSDSKSQYYQAFRFKNNTADQMVTVANKYMYDITVSRKALAWGQNYNDNYVIYDMTYTNTGTQTYDSLYILMAQNMYNVQFSNGQDPSVASGHAFRSNFTWQHYYGGRVGDSLRVFYEYSADDPGATGDQMGAPAEELQNGRLTGYQMDFYTVLHASDSAYSKDANDVDDPTEPKITYMGNDTQINSTFQSSDDPYASASFWAIKGGFSDLHPMDTTFGKLVPGTHHGLNSDELGITDFSKYPGGVSTAPQSLMHCSYGPYHLAPGQKIHIVYATGVSGIDEKTAKMVGAGWLHGTLQNPPNMPNAETGWLPSNFAFPTNNEIDRIKDRWISMGIDSVMLSAYRAKWNFDHHYQIPLEPPPPTEMNITAYSNRVEITWKDADAEALSNFAGYRVMRRVSRLDTVFYETIYDGGPTDKSDIFNDTSIVYGANYHYYVQAKARIAIDDPDADPSTRGKIMFSSRLWVQDNSGSTSPVISPNPAQDDMAKIRVAPNPCNVNDPYFVNAGTYGATSNNNQFVIFFNLPKECSIKIFSENGDLVRTKQHASSVAPSGSEIWDLTTDSGQIVDSGIYIAVFQKPDGETSYQKFVIVR